VELLWQNGSAGLHLKQMIVRPFLLVCLLEGIVEFLEADHRHLVAEKTLPNRQV
jgi:hypothetical protein